MTATTYCRECGEEAIGRNTECCIARVRHTMQTMYDIGMNAIMEAKELREALAELDQWAKAYDWYYTDDETGTLIPLMDRIALLVKDPHAA